MSSTAHVTNKLMNIQDNITDFASIDHLGRVWLNGLEMVMELTNKGAESDVRVLDPFKFLFFYLFFTISGIQEVRRLFQTVYSTEQKPWW